MVYEPKELSRYSDGLETARLGFDSRQRKDIFLLSNAKTCSGATWLPLDISLG
jgi:hypothetical protein